MDAANEFETKIGVRHQPLPADSCRIATLPPMTESPILHHGINARPNSLSSVSNVRAQTPMEPLSGGPVRIIALSEIYIDSGL